MSIKVNDKKTIFAWTMYDWANSVYPLVITSAIFPIFYEKVTGKTIDFLGHTFINTELYSYVISLSYIIISILSPLLSGIADYSGNKKSFMKFFCYLGAITCMSLFFFDVNYIGLGLLSVLLSSIGFAGSLVFYNAYLPEIATSELHDKISAKGFAKGYVGSSFLLILCLVMIMIFEIPAKYSFLLTGLWWFGFSQITFKGLPNNVYSKKPKGNKFTKGFKELKKVWKQLHDNKSLKRYMGAFFVYSMGVQTIMIMAVFFGTKEIIWTSSESKDVGLIISILVIQFIAVAGAYLTAYLSKNIGNIKALSIIVFIWILICIGSYTLVYLPLHFYIAAASIGFVMGGIQSLSRSTYSKLLPKTEDHASFFSFYDILEKVGIVIGTFGFGFIEGMFSIRASILLLIIFFILGFILLLRVPKTEVLK